MSNKAPSSYANFGKAESREIKLEECVACKLDCGKDCQVAHHLQPENASKKQAAEIYEEALFRQPPKRDDCPICFLMLPTFLSGRVFMVCCGKTICTGCDREHVRQNKSNEGRSCPFCRANLPSCGKEYMKMLKKWVDANHAHAIFDLGHGYLHGDESLGIKKDFHRGLTLFHRAAELGYADANHSLGVLYSTGDGVSKDEAKGMQYFEKGAIGGSIDSRFNVGCMAYNSGRFDQAIKHWLIAAGGGYIRAVNNIKHAMYKDKATRDHYAQALRGYTQYLDEVRSDQRDRAADPAFLLAEIAGFKPTGFEPQPRQKTAHWSKGGKGKKALTATANPANNKA
jgi:hypothetical protein